MADELTGESFNVSDYRQSIENAPSRTPILTETSDDIRRRIIGEISAALQHRKPIKLTQQMIDLGIMGHIQELIRKHDLNLKVERLARLGDEDYDDPKEASGGIGGALGI